jgi:hypothetical protein
MEDPQPCFTLIDLYTQREIVNRYIAGWSRDIILEWLSQYGIVTETAYRPYPDWKRYWFEPYWHYGLGVIFTFDGDPAISVKHLSSSCKLAIMDKTLQD